MSAFPLMDSEIKYSQFYYSNNVTEAVFGNLLHWMVTQTILVRHDKNVQTLSYSVTRIW